VIAWRYIQRVWWRPRWRTVEGRRALAKAAFETLNDDVMGEIHAGCLVGILALQNPAIFRTAHVSCIIRIAEGGVALALRKYDDLWQRQLRPVLLCDHFVPAGADLHDEIQRRRIRGFCNTMIAHYAPQPDQPRTSGKLRERLLRAQGFDTPLDFFKWAEGLLPKVEMVREELKVRYGLG
jgi:hypothetical protein